MERSRSGRPRLFPSVIFKLRGLLMAPLVLVMAFSLSWEYEGEALNIGLGLPLFALGWWLRIVSQRHLKYRIRLTEPQLALSGPYAFTRNPVYVGNIAILTGLSVLCELYWLVPICVAWAGLVYHVAVVGFEEVRLRKMFGDSYDTYRARVPRWIPHIRGLSPTSPLRPVSLGAALKAEWQCSLLLLIPLVKEVLIDGILLHKVG